MDMKSSPPTTSCTFGGTDCLPGLSCISSKCVCPASTQWTEHEGCQPSHCSPNNWAGYCAPGFTCSAGQCLPLGCLQLSPDGCQVCDSPIGAPTAITASATDSGATVAWDSPFESQAGVITAYLIQAWDSTNNSAIASQKVSPTATSGKISLDPGSYYFTVVAVISNGLFGPASGKSNVVTVGSSVFVGYDQFYSDRSGAAFGQSVSCTDNTTCPNGYMCNPTSSLCVPGCSSVYPNGYCPDTYHCVNNQCESLCSPSCSQNQTCVKTLTGYKCECKYPCKPGQCKNECGETCSATTCSPGTHCSGITCMPNTGTVCPVGAECGTDSFGKSCGQCAPNLTCEEFTCTCNGPHCPPPPVTLLDQVLEKRPQCPAYLQGDISSVCYLNLIQRGKTVDIPNIPALPDPSQGGTAGTTRKEALRTSLSPGVVLAFNSGAIKGSNHHNFADNFLNQSYTSLPGQTDIQVLFADNTNVNTMNPQKCSPSETGLCAEYGGGLSCIPGTKPVQLSPWYSSEGFKPPPPYTRAYPKYWSIWGCQKTQECARYYRPAPVFINGEWKYACVRNPVPTAQICHRPKGTLSCRHDDACDWNEVMSDAGYNAQTTGVCDISSGSGGCNLYGTVNDQLGQLKSLVPAGYVYPTAVNNSIPTYAVSPSNTTSYPITSYKVKNIDGTPLYTSQ